MSLDGNDFCIVFADVSGSSRLYVKLGDSEALRAVERCLNRIQRAAEGYEGRVVKTIGDEAMVVFESAEQGLLAACEMQQRVSDLPPVSGIKLAIRIGVHFGPVLEERGDIFGDTVNTAARLVELAPSGQILVSDDALLAVPPSLRPDTRPLDPVPVKGKRAPLRVHELVWSSGEEVTVLAERSLLPNGHERSLRLRHGSETVYVGPDRPVVTLGRDRANDLVIHDIRASRHHARIEFRQDRFILVDQSTNGTYVDTDEYGVTVVRRIEAQLRGIGKLSFGQPWTPSVPDYVEFQILG